jgi:predicted phage baseplate assembly protein
MSKPPRPHYSASTTGTPGGRRSVLDYLPLEYADFIAMQRELARLEMGIVSAGEEGDFSATLMEMSAILAHLLGVYQDRFAGEAFLSTAQSAQSMVRHGHRLGYQPDSGMSASGLVELTVGHGLFGKVARGFAMMSVPEGEERAQHYETVADLDVDARHNRLDIADAAYDIELAAGDKNLIVDGRGHGLQAGDVVVLAAAGQLHANVIEAVEEGRGTTTVTLQQGLPAHFAGMPAANVTLLCRPRTRARVFGWNANPETFPPDKLKSGGRYREPISDTAPRESHGYRVYQNGNEITDGTSSWYSTGIYLDRALDEDLGEIIVEDAGGVLTAYCVTAQHAVTVTFKTRRLQDSIRVGDTSVPVPPIEWSLSDAVTAMELSPSLARTPLLARDQVDLQTVWHASFQLALSLSATRPSDESLHSPLILSRTVPGLYPGQDLLFEDTLDGTVEAAWITSVADTGQSTAVYWERAGGSTHAWRKGTTIIHGNIARITHGSTVHEVLGGSSGTEPFLRLALKKSPVTMLPTGGGEPAIEVRVNDVTWERVRDFWSSDPDDRHYMVERDHEGATTIIFGDGRRGAIPPAGQKNIACTYRVGLGSEGNARAGQVRRIVKSHPLIESATNFLPIIGGADPVSVADVRTQATQHIRTFDRAVSLTDHADLALLYPGVARARAWWGSVAHVGGRTVPAIRLVASTATGGEVDAAGLRAYMEARRDNHVRLVLEKVTARPIEITLRVDIDPAYFAEKVKDALRAALAGNDRDGTPGMFTFAARDLGQPAYLSQVYERVTAVEGVLAAEIQRFCAVGQSSLQEAIVCEPHEWLALDKRNIVLASRMP